MNEKVKEWLWLIRIFFPEQRKWASRALTTAGLAMLAGPVWTPYADAAMEHFFGIKMPAQQLNITGWALLALGLLLLSVNVYLDHRSRSDAVLASDVADRMTLVLQVALDKLIEIGFVRHLYPGLPHQKFTVLKDGRAHYTIHSARLDG